MTAVSWIPVLFVVLMVRPHGLFGRQLRGAL